MQPDDLKRLRKAAGMTQGELAERLGLSQGFIGEMERGEKPIEARTVSQILGLFDLQQAFTQLIAVQQMLSDWERRRDIDFAGVALMESGDLRASHNGEDATTEWLDAARKRLGELVPLIKSFKERYGFDDETAPTGRRS
ncbi:helix-turn-helix domain-containing protein [Sphingomonas histidinilytica]|uniref:helix-turn-helix domain-containing protein n=1 Tax=Rhizorhabdus histidinilytica TaxID=439228 RepID=UPI001ADB43A1|nr:helix-turn-helix transcriptional regulator [Rhizorhabdus histidinilytica]MBO9377934.1 helix-turn-helix domain-containing protein [Rhizorhabdus histidinilytica]